MNVKSSSSIRNNYREVANECIETGQPTILTNNGEGELVVMSLESYNALLLDIKIQSAILEFESREAKGQTEYYSLEDADKRVLEAAGLLDETI